ncbi:hypothetical protein CVT25_005999 [Psilocybe cyanescens]|uniref:Uncharacterized protein n=1 Tax=Psilocybe cyanescens TaxID=93625 RepID=A0A409VMD0_PSICY|nr:hypothetical protein CVT25_005999 [Psilocybe cyanescens]
MSSANYPFWLGVRQTSHLSIENTASPSVAASCTHPLDVTKVRMQTLASNSGSKRPSTVSVVRTSISQSGFRSLYAGLSASLMRQMSYSLVRLGVYEKLKTRLAEGGQSSTFRLLLAACVAGGLGGIAGNPADIILVRMTSDLVRPPDKRYNYSNAFTGLLSLMKEDGLKGLSRGLGTNTVGLYILHTENPLTTLTQLASSDYDERLSSRIVGGLFYHSFTLCLDSRRRYDFFKTTLLDNPLPFIDHQLHDNLLLHLTSSCMAGMFATTVCSPADVIRSRLMAASCNTTFTQVIRNSIDQEGVRFFFKGWTPSFIRLGPNTILMFVFYEVSCRSSDLPAFFPLIRIKAT